MSFKIVDNLVFKTWKNDIYEKERSRNQLLKGSFSYQVINIIFFAMVFLVV